MSNRQKHTRKNTADPIDEDQWMCPLLLKNQQRVRQSRRLR